MKQQTFKKEKKRVFKLIKDLDSEIRTIENEQDDNKDIYYIVEVGLLESLGEQGDTMTFFYDNYPTDEEIIKDTRENLKESLEELKRSCMTYREEQHLKALNKIKDKL